MGWHIKLGGQLTVHQDGKECGPPENKTVAVLLLGLLSRHSRWSSRDELAALLYPDSDPVTRRASLRQSLVRLRRWLGASALEELQDLIRLAGSWTYDLLLDNGQTASAPMIAPGLIHPWIEAIRMEWSPSATPVPDVSAENFASAVQAVAHTDRDTGRRILVGGALLTDSLSVDRLGSLLGLTQPKDRRDPQAFEHTELRRNLYMRLGCYREAKTAQLRAFRLVSQQRRANDTINAGAMLLFLEIEDGQLGEAAAWVDYLQNVRNADTKSLMFCNAKAAYLWNMNRLDDAVSQMSQAIRRIPSADRLTRLHFWSNFAVLCAEAGRLELGQEALAEAHLLAIHGLDVYQFMTIDFAEGTRLMAIKRTEEAVERLRRIQTVAATLGYEPGDWYASEAMAEVLAISGSTVEARRLWKSVESRRLSRCTRLTPRLLARRARIMRSG